MHKVPCIILELTSVLLPCDSVILTVLFQKWIYFLTKLKEKYFKEIGKKHFDSIQHNVFQPVPKD
ncbi:hypothetical protein Hanom_Chr16g01520411 [Helianthus anomalus]